MIVFPLHVGVVPTLKCMEGDSVSWTAQVDVVHTHNMCPVQSDSYVDIIFWVTYPPSRIAVEEVVAIPEAVLSPV